LARHPLTVETRVRFPDSLLAQASARKAEAFLYFTHQQAIKNSKGAEAIASAPFVTPERLELSTR
ncbi:MAG: hypothetical protein NC405_09450, partial [Odoribacter sp.]|nr:hypothetical protein [Odoribacter sp.]